MSCDGLTVYRLPAHGKSVTFLTRTVATSSGTYLTGWCGTWHNGWPTYMEEGFNFGNNGWARFKIDTSGRGTTVGSSYAVINGAV